MDRHGVSLGLLFLRVIGGGLLIQGRSWHWGQMLNTDKLFTDPFGIGGEFNWFLTIFSEGICTVLFMAGVFARFTAVPPLVTMLILALAMPAGTAWSTRELYLLYALPFFVVTFSGPGDYSVDGRVAAWSGSR